MSIESQEIGLNFEEVIGILRANTAPMHVTDIRLAISGQRPGVIELERELLRREDLFVFVDGDRIELSPSVRDDSSVSTISNSAFDIPDIKNLIAYYEDCVREDGRRIRVYGSHLGISAIETESEWASDDRGVYSIPVSAETRDLILNNSDGSTAHYYGYPVLAQWVDEESLLKFVPILFWRLDKIGDIHQTSHRLSFTLRASDFRLNPEVLWALPRRQRQRIIDLFQNAETVSECLEMIQADFLGLEMKEILYQRRLPRNPKLRDIGKRDEGIFNRGLYLAITPSSYVKGLARDLSLLAGAYASQSLNSSIDSLLHGNSIRCSNISGTIVPASRSLNAYQESAVERAFSNPLSVVTGPPGTGKSEVVVAIVVNAILHGRSVLFASRNNGAIAVVQNRICSLLGDRNGLLRLGANFDSETKKQIQKLFSQPTQKEITEAKAAAGEYDTYYAELKEAVSLITHFEELSLAASAAEKRFLDARENFPGIPIKRLPIEFNESIQEALKRFVESIQKNDFLENFPLIGPVLFRRRFRKIAKRFHSTTRSLESLLFLEEGELTSLYLKDKQTWSILMLSCLEIFDSAQQAMSTAKELEDLGSLEELFDGLTTSKEALCKLTRDKLAFLSNEVLREASRENGFQQSARQFLDALGRKQESEVHLEHPMGSILHTLPCWTVSNLSACGRLPLTPGLFDLVIIDEASQCDIPSCIPLMFRAKQAVVIGDPMQLSPISHLSMQSEQSLLSKHGIQNPGSYRYSGNSIYDLAFASAPSEARTFLAQHYRCHPEIIEFANSSHWYNSNLEAVTDVTGLKRSCNLKLGINWLEVEGTAKIGETGFWIPEEVDRITQEVYRLLVEERFEGTVGVVTPFRRMANALQEKIEASEIHQTTLDACDFRADTAHKFQGDERDIIFYAPCYHPGMPNKHKWFLSSQKNVFNVALSRARSAFIVVGSKKGLEACGIDYLEDFVRYVENLETASVDREVPEGITRGHWEPIFEKRLRESGIPVKAQFSLGPYWLDFALISGDRCLNIEVDGEQFHKNESGMRCQKDIDRNIYVKAQGWTVMRFWVYQLRDDIDECVNQIEQWWTKTN